MKAFSKALTGIAVGIAALASLPAQAVTINFAYQTPTDGSGKTSIFVDPSNVQNPTTGLFVETFDQATANPALGGLAAALLPDGSHGTIPGVSFANASTNCSFNSVSAVGVSVPVGTVGIQSGNTTQGANPAGDNTCYAFGPGPAPHASGNDLATLDVDYKPFLAALVGLGIATPTDSIGYLGLYYGSIDTYNDIAIFNKGSLVSYGAPGGILYDGIISGSEILAAMGGQSGNQTGAGSNVYVNLFFGPGETFDEFKFQNNSLTQVAFEVDNIVVGLASKNIPEPESLALVGLGLVGVAAARRRAKQAK